MNKFYQTREVRVGTVGVGGNNPIRIQSMTTSDTRDVEATVEQIIRLADAGCDIARVTVQGMKEADACEEIKNGLIRHGYTIPLVADIHFYPPAALRVADFADKVRINPGNFVDKRATFRILEYNDLTYANELERLEEKFSPLVTKCKRLGRALRIGTNHGSLSDRIMNRYGDTPRGMVESALEFLQVCRKLDYHDVIFSMKASNTKVMIEAYRLLVEEMMGRGWDYPIHLGVTEAGEGEDGRVKSAIGIGSLLLDGIGDTIRVSLTEDPWCEIDPCKRLKTFAEGYPGVGLERVERAKVVIPKGGDLHPDGSVFTKGDLSKTFTEKDSWEPLLQKNFPYIFFAPTERPIEKTREFCKWLKLNEIEIPVILQFAYDCSEEDLVIRASAEFGSLLCDGLGEGIYIVGDYAPDFLERLSLAILQGARMRSTRTEFISCPGCGRTLFGLQEVAARIRKRTGHLPGVKIAIMGCIVNGPGEMADADFGYVGSRPGKIDLYVGKECVEKNIDMAEADERLIALIKAHGRWVDQIDGPCVK